MQKSQTFLHGSLLQALTIPKSLLRSMELNRYVLNLYPDIQEHIGI